MKSLVKSFQQTHFAKSVVYFIVGVTSYPGLAIVNSIKISGTENLKHLPRRNVLFVSNHQTYFADVITFLHIFCAVKWSKENKLGIPFYLLNPVYPGILCGRSRNHEKHVDQQNFYLGRGYYSEAYLALRRKRSKAGA